MNKLSSLLIILSLAVIVLPVGVTVAHTEDEPLSVDLLVGKTKDIGDVKVWNDRENLYVSYVSSTDACLRLTHLAVVTDLADIPLNREGRPAIFQFEYSDPHDCVQEYTYVINLAEKGWTVDTPLYIAAQAATRTETAWADGLKIVRIQCGTYFTYTVQCTPETICVDWSDIAPGTNIEGLGAVDENLNIDARRGTAVKVEEAQDPVVYFSGNWQCGHPTQLPNGGLASGGGFSDVESRDARKPHWYSITFAPGATVREFTLHMLDFGDYNPSAVKGVPSAANFHYAAMIAYDADGNVVDRRELTYDSNGRGSPQESPQYGDLLCGTGDAIYAAEGEPGNWTWHVEGPGIARVELVFEKDFDPLTYDPDTDRYTGDGFDPWIAFDGLCYTIERCPD